MYTDVRSKVRVGDWYIEEFGVRVDVHQGSVLSPILFIIGLEALSWEFRAIAHTGGSQSIPVHATTPFEPKSKWKTRCYFISAGIETPCSRIRILDLGPGRGVGRL